MKINEVSKKTGISSRMIRFYEDKELIKPNRTTSNYRLYNRNDIEVLMAIKSLNKVGFNLNDIKLILPCYSYNTQKFQVCNLVKNKMLAMQQNIENRIFILTNIKTRINIMLNNE